MWTWERNVKISQSRNGEHAEPNSWKHPSRNVVIYQSRKNISAVRIYKRNAFPVIPKEKANISGYRSSENLGRWALDYMDIEKYFGAVYTLEDLSYSKKEIFEKILSDTKLSPEQCISIWDQYESDIVPAESLWMKTHLVQDEKDLAFLLSL